MATSDVVTKLKEQVQCTLCDENVPDPKTLLCLHSFCQHCLQRVPVDIVESNKYSLNCPTCRVSCELPESGINGLPSFLINSFNEVYTLMKNASNANITCNGCDKVKSCKYCTQCKAFFCKACLSLHSQLKLNAKHNVIGVDSIANSAYELCKSQEVTMKCSSHDKPLDIFCETCEELICLHCILRAHKDHDFNSAKDVYSKHRVDLEEVLGLLNEQFSQFSDVKDTLQAQKDTVIQQKESHCNAIDTMIEKFCEKGRKCKEQVELVSTTRLSIVDKKLSEAEIAFGEIKQCSSFIEESLKVQSAEEFLCLKQKMKNRSQSIITSAKKKNFQPIEETGIELKMAPDVNIICNNFCSIHYTITKPEVHLHKPHPLFLGKKSQCTISLKSNSFPVHIPTLIIKCYLTPLTRHQPTVEETSKLGEYIIKLTPDVRGEHLLHVKIGKAELHNSPVSVNVSVPPEMRGNVVKIFELERPVGVAVTTNGMLIVTQFSKKYVSVLNKDGESICNFRSLLGKCRRELRRPRGVAISSNGTILVTDDKNHSVNEFTMDGKCIACVGTEGSGPLQFLNPEGIAVNKVSGRIYITDYGNDRVQVLNPDLSFYCMFGHHGSMEKQFKYPYGITVDNITGDVYVTDYNSQRIQKFTADGEFVSMFNTKVEHPRGIVYFDNVLYVTSDVEGIVISMYSTNGDYIKSIGSHYKLSMAEHVAVDHEEYLYACCKSCICKFS